MQEPTLKEDRLLIVKDIVILVTLAGLVLAVAVLCLVFAKRLTDEHKPGPAAVLIILTVCSVMLYAIWMFVSVLYYLPWWFIIIILTLVRNS
jgi:uncharacterized membrane protein YhaH (DUF805 family)